MAPCMGFPIISTMGMTPFLMYLVVMSTLRLGPDAYKDLQCVEPVHGYAMRIIHYFIASGMEVCPTTFDVAWRFWDDALRFILCDILFLLYAILPSIAGAVTRKWSSMVSMVQEWKNRRPLCQYCGTAPCQAQRRSAWHPQGPFEMDEANYSERSRAMMLFNCALEVATLLTHELPQDELYWKRRACHSFEEEHMGLFPVCIQRQIDHWYPVPR